MKSLIAALLIGFTAVAPAAPLEPIALGKPFVLQVGQSLSLGNSEWTLTFVRVVSDSRCRPPAQCLCAGDAELELRAKRNSQRDTFGFSLNTMSKTSEIALRQRVTIKVLELPAGNKPAKLATLIVSQP